MSEVQVIIRAIDKMTPTTNKVRGSLGGLTDGFKTAGLVMAGFAAAGFAVGKVLAATVGSVVAYNKSILDSARAVGISTDQFSRIVQVADDFGISMESVKTALQLATKNGFAPSVESMAALADRLNGMATPTERAAAAAKIFGRNWAALDPILQQGGKAIREASAAIEDGLVVTENEAFESEKLRLQIDALNDRWTSLKNIVGQEVIPALLDFMTRSEELRESAIASDEGLVAMARGTAYFANQAATAAAETERFSNWLLSVQEHSGRVASTAESAGSSVQQLAAGLKSIPTFSDWTFRMHTPWSNEVTELSTQMHIPPAKAFVLLTQAGALRTAAENIQKQKDANAAAENSPGGLQHGGSFIVPGSGSGDRPYVVQLEPGERVDVTPRNQVKNFTFNTNVADGTDGSVLLSKFNEAARRA